MSASGEERRDPLGWCIVYLCYERRNKRAKTRRVENTEEIRHFIRYYSRMEKWAMDGSDVVFKETLLYHHFRMI